MSAHHPHVVNKVKVPFPVSLIIFSYKIATAVSKAPVTAIVSSMTSGLDLPTLIVSISGDR